ncbi:hypothetical protein LNP26_14335 [Klebsiella variicola subsp. variicola]|nr:hypothetical protein [Klebsiella variicola subsp. variicola]
MAGRIPRVFISDLLARTDIVDLIDARVKLKKQGKIFTRAVRSITKKPPLSPSTVKNSFTTASAAGRTAMLSTS